jgi:hypothetical protein
MGPSGASEEAEAVILEAGHAQGARVRPTNPHPRTPEVRSESWDEVGFFKDD